MKAIVNGLATEYEDSGAGPAILFLHGWKADLHTFDGVIPLIKPGHRIIRLDMPGFGGTEVPRTAWEVRDYAVFVSDFLKKIGVASYTIVGHSFGCRVAIKGTATGVLSPNKLILIGAAGISHSKSARNRLITAITKAGKAALAVVPVPRLKAALRKRVYEAVKSDYLTVGPLKDTYVKIVGEDLSKSAPLIRVPTLLIYGSTDEQTTVSEAKVYEKLIMGSKLTVHEGRGHFVHEEAPAEIAQDINDFI